MKNDLIQRLLKDAVKNIFETEMAEHLWSGKKIIGNTPMEGMGVCLPGLLSFLSVKYAGLINPQT